MSALRQLWATLVVLIFAVAPMAMLAPDEGLEEPTSEDDRAPHVVHRRVAKAQTVRPRRGDEDDAVEDAAAPAMSAALTAELDIVGAAPRTFELDRPCGYAVPANRVWFGTSARGPPTPA